MGATDGVDDTQVEWDGDVWAALAQLATGLRAGSAGRRGHACVDAPGAEAASVHECYAPAPAIPTHLVGVVTYNTYHIGRAMLCADWSDTEHLSRREHTQQPEVSPQDFMDGMLDAYFSAPRNKRISMWYVTRDDRGGLITDTSPHAWRPNPAGNKDVSPAVAFMNAMWQAWLTARGENHNGDGRGDVLMAWVVDDKCWGALQGFGRGAQAKAWGEGPIESSSGEKWTRGTIGYMCSDAVIRALRARGLLNVGCDKGAACAPGDETNDYMRRLLAQHRLNSPIHPVGQANRISDYIKHLSTVPMWTPLVCFMLGAWVPKWARAGLWLLTTAITMASCVDHAMDQDEELRGDHWHVEARGHVSAITERCNHALRKAWEAGHCLFAWRGRVAGEVDAARSCAELKKM